MPASEGGRFCIGCHCRCCGWTASTPGIIPKQGSESLSTGPRPNSWLGSKAFRSGNPRSGIEPRFFVFDSLPLPFGRIVQDVDAATRSLRHGTGHGKRESATRDAWLASCQVRKAPRGCAAALPAASLSFDMRHCPRSICQGTSRTVPCSRSACLSSRAVCGCLQPVPGGVHRPNQSSQPLQARR